MLQYCYGKEVVVMKKVSKVLVFLFVTALAVSMLTACGGAKEQSNNSGKSGHFIIATDKDFSPFEYFDEDNNLVGFDVDLLEAIALDQQFTYELKAVGWDAAVTALQTKSDSIDGMIAGASITEERKAAGWIYSDGYFTATQTLFVKKTSKIKSFEDLKEKTVGAVGDIEGGEKTLGYKYAEEIKDKYNFTLNPYKTYTDLYKAVEKGEIEAGFGDTPAVSFEIIYSQLNLKTIKETENEGFSYGFVISNPDKQKLLDLFNKGLANIKANGTYNKIVAKYFGEQMTEPETTTEAPTETTTEAPTDPPVEEYYEEYYEDYYYEEW